MPKNLGEYFSTQTLIDIFVPVAVVGGVYGLYKLYTYQKGDSLKKEDSSIYSTSSSSTRLKSSDEEPYSSEDYAGAPNPSDSRSASASASASDSYGSSSGSKSNSRSIVGGSKRRKRRQNKSRKIRK